MYYNWKDKTNTEELKIVCNLIRNGELVIFPTETVYGIGVNALDTLAVGKLFLAKERSSDNPLIVHLADKRKIEEIADEITEVEQELIDNFMPGPFTLLLKKKPIIPDVITAGLDTVAVRIPDNIIAKGIITYSGLPIAVSSANISGGISGTNYDDIKKELKGKVSAIIDGGDAEIGIESTIVRVVDEVPVIIRPGKITPEEIKKVCSKVSIDSKVFAKDGNSRIYLRPDLKDNSYYPETKCKLLYCENELDQIFYLKKMVKEYQGNLVIIGFDEHKEKVILDDERFISVGSINNLDEFAKKIYSSLRKADRIRPRIIIIEGVKKEGLGLAIMNRLLKICNYDIFER